MTQYRIRKQPLAALTEGARAPLPDDVAFALQILDPKSKPLIVDDANAVIAEHDRFEAAKRAGVAFAPTLSVAEIRRAAEHSSGSFSIADVRRLHLKARMRPIHSLAAPLAGCFTATAITRAVETLRELGFHLPIFVDGAGFVEFGDQYVAAAQVLDMREIPVVCIRDLNEVELTRYVGMLERKERPASQARDAQLR